MPAPSPNPKWFGQATDSPGSNEVFEGQQWGQFPGQGNIAVGNSLSLDGIATGEKQLSTLDSLPYNAGTFAWVESVGAHFKLQQQAQVINNITVVAAAGKDGYQWVRMNWLNPKWAAVTAWAVDTTAGSDENVGTGSNPLLTLSELARRLSFATLTVAVTVTVAGNVLSTDTAVFTFYTGVGGSFTLTGTPTVLYTGTISGTTAAGAAPTTGDNTLTDAAITGGSFTAAGAMALGVLFSRTSGTVCSWFACKDKGSQTTRISVPMSNFFTGTTIAPGDNYNFAQLPTLGVMPRFPNAVFGGGQNVTGAVTLTKWLVTGTVRPFEIDCLLFTYCWMTGAKLPAGTGVGCCMLTGNSQFIGTASNFGSISSAMYGGCVGTATISGTLFISSCRYFQLPSQTAALTLQTSQIQVSEADFEQNGADILAYDSAGYVFLIDYNAKFLQKHGGAFGGSGNAKLCNVGHGAWFMHTTTPYWLAGSSTDTVTPILANGSGGISVDIETAGGGVPNAQQNGVFPTS